jgi:preprotein translocase subunit SecG
MKLNKYSDNILYRLLRGYYQSHADEGGGGSMKNSSLVSARYCEQALSVASAICVLLFTGCASIDGTAENHKAAANLVTRHVEQEQQNQAVEPGPDYEWFY